MKKVFVLLMVCLFVVSAQTTNNDMLLGKYYKMKSEKIGEEREFYVSVPAGYDNSGETYPVLYMMDADWNFTAGTVGGIRYLERLNEIPRLIIVGVINTDRSRDVFPWEFTRRDGTKSGGGAENYLAFFREELRPFIETNYRTADYKIFYGTSNSGLTAVYDMFYHPEDYDAYLAASPTLRSPFPEKTDSLINNWKGGKKYLNLIIGENDFVGLPRRNAELKEKIDRIKPEGITLKFNILEGEGHVPNTSIFVGLKDLFEGWKFSETLSEYNYQSFLNHYEALNKRLTLEVKPPERILNLYAYSLLRNPAKVEKSIEVFKFIVEQYPQSFNAYDSLGEAYLTAGNKKLSLINYKKSLELNPENENAKMVLSRLEKE